MTGAAFLVGVHGGFDAVNRPGKAAIEGNQEQQAMAETMLKVRTIRPHDTAQGLRSPGDEYERSKADAEQLEAAGVVAIMPAAKPKRAKAAR